MSKKSEELLKQILDELKLLSNKTTLITERLLTTNTNLANYKTEEKELIDNFKKLWDTNQGMMKSYDNQILQFTNLLESEKKERRRKFELLKDKENIEKLFFCLQILKNSEWYSDLLTSSSIPTTIPASETKAVEQKKKKKTTITQLTTKIVINIEELIDKITKN